MKTVQLPFGWLCVLPLICVSVLVQSPASWTVWVRALVGVRHALAWHLASAVVVVPQAAGRVGGLLMMGLQALAVSCETSKEAQVEQQWLAHI